MSSPRDAQPIDSRLAMRVQLLRPTGIRYDRDCFAFQLTQFHLPYYSSRPLLNIIAFFVSTEALSFHLPVSAVALRLRKRYYQLGIWLLTFAAAAFRFELAIFEGLCRSSSSTPADFPGPGHLGTDKPDAGVSLGSPAKGILFALAATAIFSFLLAGTVSVGMSAISSRN